MHIFIYFILFLSISTLGCEDQVSQAEVGAGTEGIITIEVETETEVEAEVETEAESETEVEAEPAVSTTLLGALLCWV